MRFLVPALAASTTLGLLVFTACGSSTTHSTGAGASTASTSHSSGTLATSSSSGTPAASSSGSGHTSSGSGTTSSSGAGGAGGNGVGGGGTGGTVSVSSVFECTVPSTPPSGGSCVTYTPMPDGGTGTGGSDGGTIVNACDPITNAGCSTGEECDGNFDQTTNAFLGFVCYPPPNNAVICGMCDPSNGPYCGGGLSCQPYDNNDDTACEKYCCSDQDCGAGKCVVPTDQNNNPLFAPFSQVGFCAVM